MAWGTSSEMTTPSAPRKEQLQWGLHLEGESSEKGQVQRGRESEQRELVSVRQVPASVQQVQASVRPERVSVRQVQVSVLQEPE